MIEQSFSQRFGLAGKPVTDGFPEEAIVALAYLLVDLVREHFIDDWDALVAEIGRFGGILDFRFDRDKPIPSVVGALKGFSWHRVFSFCERVHKRLLRAPGYYDNDGDWVATGTVADAHNHYEKELNDLLVEHNMGYVFTRGQFQRRGRVQTQKSIQRAGTVLSQPRLERTLAHFNKARKFFDRLPEPDAENAVKEAVCALEACVQVVCGKAGVSDFPKLVKELEGNGAKQVPPTIAQVLMKLYAYRGNAQGVAHAAVQGSKVGPLEAELVLSLVASCITYLADLRPEEEEEIPF